MTKLIVTLKENSEGFIDIEWSSSINKDSTSKEITTINALTINMFNNVEFKKKKPGTIEKINI